MAAYIRGIAVDYHNPDGWWVMNPLLEVPNVSDLDEYPVEVVLADEPGVVNVKASAHDGSSVALTWDVTAGSARICWKRADDVQWIVEREGLSKISVREERDRIEFWIWSGGYGFRGELVVRIGKHVYISDVLLRV
ncbi:hypothetical protein [Amycolatopsis silviterrae]|uniref:Uncharacterized protein n=1 Tax=Amycolatopsis silviterrae TaxID=1656914 RepID=A0ABW5H716_9PSEU